MGEGGRHDPTRWLCVVCGVVERDGSLLLVRQRAKHDSDEGFWVLPGGVVAVECADVATPGGQDPDDIVKEAAWVPRADALDRLGALPFRRMAEPSAAVLSGRAPEGSIWTYEADAGGDDELRATFPG